MPIIQQYSRLRDFAAVVPVSAVTGENTDRLLEVIKENLEEGPQYYPEDEVTDQPERVVAAELIREKIFRMTRDEIPHSTAVEVEEMKTVIMEMFFCGRQFMSKGSRKKGSSSVQAVPC